MPSPHEHLLHEQSWERVGWGGTGRRAVQMKILQVLPALDQGGVEWDAVELALALKAQGVENGIASAGGALVDKIAVAGVPHHDLPLALYRELLGEGR